MSSPATTARAIAAGIACAAVGFILHGYMQRGDDLAECRAAHRSDRLASDLATLTRPSSTSHCIYSSGDFATCDDGSMVPVYPMKAPQP